MTNVYGTPKKRATRTGLFSLAVETLEREGYSVERVPRGGKASLRRITKGGESHTVSIRTSQDGWIAFPRKTKAAGWVTLDEVDFVVASSVNERHNPTIARVHLMPADEVRARFDRAWEARKAAGHTLPIGRGIWLGLYQPEEKSPVSLVGAGMGLEFKALTTVDLTKEGLPTGAESPDDEVVEDEEAQEAPEEVAEPPLTIADAKRRLALSQGVPETAIRIIIEH